VSGPDPPVVREPEDLFTQEVAPVLDEARTIIAELGLRPHRVFLVIDKYEGPRHKQGDLVERELTELAPAPVVAPFSAAQVATSGGAVQMGDVALRQISRSYTSEQLRGRTLAGDELPGNWDFFIAIQPYGQIHAEFYNVASRPTLLPTAWEMIVRPRNKRGPLVIGPD
jgi:hypothetical protein